jgi:hypothetical protein
MVLRVVVQNRIVQMFNFAATKRFIRAETTDRFVVMIEFYPRAVAHHVVVP